MDVITIVISTLEGFTSFNVDKVIAFPVLEAQDRTLVSENAEAKFSELCLQNGADEDEINIYIEDGRFKSGEILIELIWAETVI